MPRHTVIKMASHKEYLTQTLCSDFLSMTTHSGTTCWYKLNTRPNQS